VNATLAINPAAKARNNDLFIMQISLEGMPLERRRGSCAHVETSNADHCQSQRPATDVPNIIKLQFQVPSAQSPAVLRSPRDTLALGSEHDFGLALISGSHS
jgi:hypothetical protein